MRPLFLFRSLFLTALATLFPVSSFAQTNNYPDGHYGDRQEGHFGNPDDGYFGDDHDVRYVDSKAQKNRQKTHPELGSNHFSDAKDNIEPSSKNQDGQSNPRIKPYILTQEQKSP